MRELIQDEEFDALVLPVSEEEYDALEEDIFDNGCREPIVVWNDIIIDGRKRYRICMQWEVPFDIRSMEFANRYEVISWICKNQLLREDLPEIMKRYLIGVCCIFQRESYRQKKYQMDISGAHPEGHPRLAVHLAKELQISEDIIYKHTALAKALMNIAAKNRSICDKILSGRLRISQVNIQEMAQLSGEELQILDLAFQEDRKGYVSLKDIRHELQWRRTQTYTSCSSKKKEGQPRVLIKETPAYDPDAEISSLTYTIPSWVSSLDRTRSVADFPKTTEEARERLLRELVKLRKAVNSIQKQVKKVEANG